jgi:hypothetical protein
MSNKERGELVEFQRVLLMVANPDCSKEDLLYKAADLKVDLDETGASLVIWKMLAIIVSIVFVLFYVGMLGKTCF